MKKLLLPILSSAALLSSCVVGRHLSFQDKVAGPGYIISKTAVVVVQDSREEVLSGKEKASFCGHAYSTVQIAYNIQTKSGQPLADEFATAISHTCTNGGAAAKPIFVSINTAADSVIAGFKAGNDERLLYFTIKKWEARAVPLFTSIRYEVIYHLTLNVYDKNGGLLATGETHDTVTKEEGGAVSIATMQAMADTIFKEQVEGLFKKDDVQKSLTGN